MLSAFTCLDGIEFLMYAAALFGFRIFDPIPLARQTANPAAFIRHAGARSPGEDRQSKTRRGPFGMPARRLQGVRSRLLPPALIRWRSPAARGSQGEISWGAGRKPLLSIGSLS